MPDAVGNLYRSKDQTDRTYHKGGKLLHDEKYHYLYDPNGNLKLKTPRKVAQRQIDLRQEQLNAHKPKKFSFFVEEVPQHKTKDLDYYLRNDRTYTQAEKEEYKRLKAQENLQIAQNEQWQRGDWEYTWNANGSLKSVKLPDGNLVEYEYDALGRRTKKLANGKIKRYLWDGNVLLHEWEYNVEEKPRRIVNKLGEVSFDKPEPINNLITWVYEQGSFVPCAKLTEQGNFSIISDYLGTPIQAYNQQGELVWERELDIYGQTRKEKGISNFVPFRYQGQYYDEETNLCYNRFRYYSPEAGLYISKDPISILGGLNVYAYVKDVNKFVDIFGLDVSIGEVGTYQILTKNSLKFDDIDIHHIPQDKLGFLPKNEGIAVAMPKHEHALTRTYKGRGIKTAMEDKARLFKDILKDDLVDLINIGGAKYENSVKEIISKYEDLGMLKKGELTLKKIKNFCKK